jgi:cation channel sperm-associated protein 3
MDEATEEDMEYKKKKRETHRLMKREVFLKKQRQDLTQLVQKSSQRTNIHTLLQELAGKLRHEDVLPMNSLSCDPAWMEAFITSLNYQEATMYRVQQLQFGVANILAEIGISFRWLIES